MSTAVDRLAAIIRDVDGSHELGAGTLAEALIARGVEPPDMRPKVGDYIGRITDQGGGEWSVDGFCGGQFGRDHYDLEKVVRVESNMIEVVNRRGGHTIEMIPVEQGYRGFDSWEELSEYVITRTRLAELDREWEAF